MTRRDQERHTTDDQRAQQHPEGNVPDRVEFPDIGLPVDDGAPSGEQNDEQDVHL